MFIRNSRIIASVLAMVCSSMIAHAGDFHIQEASIDSIQSAIRSGEVTCKQVVESYIARAKAYNGSCTQLVTLDGKKIAQAFGATRAGSPVKFPTTTVALSKIVPDLDKYTGLLPDYGRMETTMSDPSV